MPIRYHPPTPRRQNVAGYALTIDALMPWNYKG